VNPGVFTVVLKSALSGERLIPDLQEEDELEEQPISPSTTRGLLALDAEEHIGDKFERFSSSQSHSSLHSSVVQVFSAAGSLMIHSLKYFLI